MYIDFFYCLFSLFNRVEVNLVIYTIVLKFLKNCEPPVFLRRESFDWLFKNWILMEMYGLKVIVSRRRFCIWNIRLEIFVRGG